MQTNLILPTGNLDKAEEIRAILQGLPLPVLTLFEVGVEGEPQEPGPTLQENALSKALFAHDARPGDWSAGDDTGIFFDALGGRPGIYSKRWAGEGATTAQITRHALNEMREKQNRSAVFRTVVALVSPLGQQCFFQGEVRGRILEEQRVMETRPKMPYDPIFVPEGYDRPLAAMDISTVSRISHRGQAFALVRKFFQEVIFKSPVSARR